MTVEERCKNGYSLNRRQLFRWMYSHGYSKARMAHCLKITKKEFIWRLDFWEPFEKWRIKRLVRIMKAKAAIEKAFRNQVEGVGYSFVEVVSTCPTNWGMSPTDAMAWMEENNRH